MTEFLPTYLNVAYISMMPILEARAATVFGIAYGLSPLPVMLVATFASFVTAFIILLALTFLTKWLRTIHPTIDKFFTWLFEKTYHKHSRKFERWGVLALTLFVAIPLPFSGAWTGALLAYLFGIKLHHSAVLLLVGIFLSVVISAMFALGVQAIL